MTQPIHIRLARLRARMLTLALAGMMSACTLGPDFQPPAEDAPAQWKANAGVESTVLPERWWTLFHDDELSALVERALARNQELEAGLARVERARALAGLARSAQSPTVSIDPSVERESFSANRSAPPGANRDGYTSTTFELPLDISYEVDLWGRLRRAREAAEAVAQASAFDYAALSIAISSEVARTYFALQSAQREEEVLRAAAELRKRAFDILTARARTGVANELDTSRAQVELARVEADRHSVARGRMALENALAVLCGDAPADFTHGVSEPGTEPLLVPPGLPSELLRRRPDIAAAQERLHEASARIGLVEAEAYPRLSLTASVGLVSTELGELLEASSRTGSLGAAMSAPIYEGGASTERNRAAQAFYEEQLADYHAALLVAFREVEDALSARAELDLELASQSEARTAAQRTLDLAEARYRQGLVGFLDVVDAARSELDARRSIVQLERLRSESTVLLIQALGGGWKPPAAAGAE